MHPPHLQLNNVDTMTLYMCTYHKHNPALLLICICNSMARSEIWDKFHECCSENGKNCTRRSRVQFCHSHYNTSEIYPKISLLAML